MASQDHPPEGPENAIRSRSERLSEPDSAKIKASVKEQRVLCRKVGDSRCFTEQEKQALTIGSFEDFKPYWEVALGDKRTFDLDHAHGVRHVGQKLNHFGSSTYDVIQKFEPLIDVVKDSGLPGAGMAIGIITFCFAAAKTRHKMEIRVNITLSAIQDRLPGIRMYKDIYDDAATDRHNRISAAQLVQEFHSKLVDAYESFVDFCIAAVEFYTMGGFMRHMRALGGSSKLDQKAARVQDCVIAVKSVCEELLSLNMDAVKRINLGLEEDIQSLKEEIKGLRDSQDREDVDKIRELLKIKARSKEMQTRQMAQHRDDIIVEFGQDYLPHTPFTVTSHPKFMSWKSSSKPCILVLAGYNAVPQAAHCWISTIALDFITELDRSRPQDPSILYILGARDARKEENTFQYVLSSIILRLLELNREILRQRGKSDELLAVVSEYSKVAEDQLMDDQKRVHLAQHLLVKVALIVLDMFDSSSSKPIWIVLDRLDRCQSTDRSSARNTHRKALLKALVRMVQEDGSKARLRVLVVVNAIDWQVQIDELDLDGKKGDRVVVQEFHQDMLY